MWRDTGRKQKCLRLPEAWVETWHRYFPRTFRGSTALLILFLASPTVRQQISVVIGHLVCSTLLWQPYESNTGWKSNISKPVAGTGAYLQHAVLLTAYQKTSTLFLHPPWPKVWEMELIHFNHRDLFAIPCTMWPNSVQEVSLKGLLYPRWCSW